MIFVDTSGLYAAMTETDGRHTAAARAWESFRESRASLITTNYVVTEATSLMQARFGVSAVRRLHEELLPPIAVHFIDRALHDAAINLLFSEPRRHLSFVDCSSFAFMRHAGIRRAFAFDDDFKRMGFEPV